MFSEYPFFAIDTFRTNVCSDAGRWAGTVAEMVDQPAGESFGVDVSKHGDVVVLTVSGALDVISAPRLSTVGASAAAVATGGMVIDLTEVSLLSSSGLTALLRTVDGLPEGRRAALVAPHPGVHRPITLSGLDLVITTEEDLDAAIRAVQ